MKTANEIKAMWEANKDDAVKLLSDRLKRCQCYSKIGDRWIKSEVERLYAGGKPSGAPSLVISILLKNGIRKE